jgi:ankyrin repeat protein
MKKHPSPFRVLYVLFCAFCVPSLLIAAEPNKLADAAMRGDKGAVRMFLQQHVDVNFPQADGATALHWAVYHDDSEMTQLLLRAGANPKAVNREGASVLSLACENGDAVIIESLLKAGAEANERLPNGETPLMMAARTGNVDAIQVLLDHGADVNAKEKLRGTTALMWAAAQSHPAAIKLLIEHGADFAARSNPISKGRTAYLAPTPADRRRTGGAEAIAAGTGQFAGQGQRTGRGQRNAAAVADAQDPSGESGPNPRLDGGGLTPLVFAARQGALDSVKVLVEAGADVNQATQYGWTPLLTATQNKYYKVGSYLLDHGANPNIANKGGWTPLYIATDNRNIEGGDYPVRKPDLDHLDFIKLLLEKGADPNARAIDSTETRTIFTMQWLYEDGATPFLRAAQSGDVTLMKLLLAHGSDPKIPTRNGDTALMAAAGIGWVEGVTSETSEKENLEAVQICLDLGIDVNAVDGDGRTALHGAAHKGRNAVVQLLVEHGAKLDARDKGSRDTINGELLGYSWQPIDYADGLVRVGVQSAVPHPETAALLRKLMTDRGLAVPPPNRTLESICITDVCK